MPKGPIRSHFYHGEAFALHGELKLPYPTTIERKAHAKIYQPKPGYESQQGKPFRAEGVVSYSAAYTQAAGHLEDQEKKEGAGYKTLATAVVENLNILNVVTADRIVSQISTEHPLYEEEGHVPIVTFLGTQFVNLRIGGFPVEVELDLDLLDPAKHDRKLAFTRNPALKERMKERLAGFRQRIDEFLKLRKTNKDKVEPDADFVTAFHANYGSPANGNDKDKDKDKDKKDKESAVLTLVKGVKTSAPWAPIGNVFAVPHFGEIRLGVVRIDHWGFDGDTPKTTLINLNMVEFTMGCIGSGTGRAGCAISNGSSTPGTGGG